MLSAVVLVAHAAALLLSPAPAVHRAAARRAPATLLQVVSPFEGGDGPATSAAGEGPFDLTMENVDMVLDEMRPYLMADGGNVAVREIEGGIVKLELQGACGSCPSSTMTLKMGLERGAHSPTLAVHAQPNLTETGAPLPILQPSPARG